MAHFSNGHLLFGKRQRIVKTIGNFNSWQTQESLMCQLSKTAPLTGSNVLYYDGDKVFTCVELEVFALY